jgi:hypothetical protein
MTAALSLIHTPRNSLQRVLCVLSPLYFFTYRCLAKASNAEYPSNSVSTTPRLAGCCLSHCSSRAELTGFQLPNSYSTWTSYSSHCLLKLKLKLKLIYDRQSVGQSVLVSGAHLGPVTNFLSLWNVLQTVAAVLFCSALSDERTGL